MEEDRNILEMETIYKQFPGVLALDGVNFSVQKGEVHALIGENGAGKSTLIKILTGIYTKDEGRIIIGGRQQEIRSPRDAEILGIATVYQDLNLIHHFNGVQNIFLGHESTSKLGIPQWIRMREEGSKLLKGLGIELDLDIPIFELTRAEQQTVSIARALSRKSSIFVMDEVTSSISRKETEFLFDLIRGLRREGYSVIYISHRLEEIFEIADRVTIIRNGKNVGTLNVDECDLETVVRMMVGKEMGGKFFKKRITIGRDIFSVRGLSGGIVRDVSFGLHEGEILGITGLIGSGKTELAQLIFGIRKTEKGEISVNGKKVSISSPRDAMNNNIYLVPEDRMTQGLVLGMTVRENLTLSTLNTVSNYLGLIKGSYEKTLANRTVEELSIATPSIDNEVRYLSGGNQQKVVLGKGMATESRVYVFDEPTHGVDVGAKKEIYALMMNLLEKGTAIILISSEIPEVLAMSDRIIVMRNGRIQGELGAQETRKEEILMLAYGEKEGKARRDEDE
jgi:ribose transport system ATP-binding protein